MGEPSENPAPPKKRRRRWLLVAIALGLISLTTWWNWPRGDARLVGKWRFVREDGILGVLTLHPNGAAVLEVPSNDRARFSWRVENEKLIYGTPMGGRMQSVCIWLASHALNWTGTYYSFAQSEQSIAEVTHDRFILRVDGTPGSESTATFERIPD